MYSTEIDGQTLEFGTSGLLYRSNKLMYDRATETLWHQFLGEPVVGELAYSGIKLELLPVVLTTWQEWLAAHPDTTVFDIDTGVYPSSTYRVEQDSGSIYYSYRQDTETMFPVWQQNDQLATRDQVLGLNLNGQPRAYLLDLLKREPVINDSLGGINLVVATVAGASAARAYERGSNTFSAAQTGDAQEETVILTDQQGHRWRMEEEALVREDDPTKSLRRLPSHIAYWFGWYGFYPDTDLYGQQDGSE